MKNLRANCLQVKVFLHNEGQCENDFWGRLRKINVMQLLKRIYVYDYSTY